MAPRTTPDTACAGGLEGMRMRVRAHRGPESEPYARILGLRECATGATLREPPLSALPWWIVFALGALFGTLFGMVCGTVTARAQASAHAQVAR